VRTAFMGLTSSGGVAVGPTVAARAPVPHLFSTDPDGGQLQRSTTISRTRFASALPPVPFMTAPTIPPAQELHQFEAKPRRTPTDLPVRQVGTASLLDGPPPESRIGRSPCLGRWALSKPQSQDSEYRSPESSRIVSSPACTCAQPVTSHS
jgi:hypothetical protein